MVEQKESCMWVGYTDSYGNAQFLHRIEDIH